MTPGTVACQVPWAMGFSRQKYWSGLQFPPPGDIPDPGIKPGSPAWQENSLPWIHWAFYIALQKFNIPALNIVRAVLCVISERLTELKILYGSVMTFHFGPSSFPLNIKFCLPSGGFLQLCTLKNLSTMVAKQLLQNPKYPNLKFLTLINLLWVFN